MNGLHVTRSYHQALSGEAWARLLLSQATATELVKNKKIEMTRGTAKQAEQLIDLFDRYKPEKALLVTPHLNDQGMASHDLLKATSFPAISRMKKTGSHRKNRDIGNCGRLTRTAGKA